MKLKPLYLAITLGLTFSSQPTFANNTKQTSIEVITVKAPKLIHSETALAEGNLVMPDVADWLKTVPGANINKNGPITGIAQYRGMYGDRISKSISGHQIISAGPNAMDAPLTYINPIMVDAVAVYRGIAPVNTGIDTLGGSVEVNLKRAAASAETIISGDMATSYNDINNASTLAANVNVSGNNFGILSYFSDQTGDDYKSAKIPMLPVISGVKITKINIFIYAVLLFPIILTPFILNYFGIFYFSISGTLSIYYIYICYKLLITLKSRTEKKIAKHIFTFSILFLFVIFTSILIDSLI